MDYGGNIKAARKAAGLTQAALAEKCGLATVTVRQYESGKREPRLEQLQRIAAALNVSVGYLLYGHTLRAKAKVWKSDKLARLYMRIDSTLLDDLEICAKSDSVPLEDMIEEILYWEVQNRIEDEANERNAIEMQKWYESRRQDTSEPPPPPSDSKDAAAGENPLEGLEKPGEGE